MRQALNMQMLKLTDCLMRQRDADKYHSSATAAVCAPAGQRGPTFSGGRVKYCCMQGSPAAM